MRVIERASRVGCRTFLFLECSHARSIGGHTLPSGTVLPDPVAIVGTTYDCQDGMCYDGPHGGACGERGRW